MSATHQPLFATDAAAPLALLQSWHIHPAPDQIAVHEALAARKLAPDESTLRRAAIWLQTLFSHLPIKHRPDYTEILAEKSALVIRLAHRHAAHLASELEAPGSPLHPIESAARFLPHCAHALPGDVLAVATLRQSLAALDLPPTPPPEADPTWHDNRRRLQQLVLHDNPHRFLTWPVVQNSMFMNDAAIAKPEFAALQAQQDFNTRWLPALQEDTVGAPARSELLSTSSNNLIHHAYNLLQLELTGIRLNSLGSILEFGGGYGSAARLAHRLGFRGNYIIFDLPEFSALQRFFLASLNFPVTAARAPLSTHHSISLVSSMDELRRLIPTSAADLFLATWSLSETPAAFRAQFVPFLRQSSHLLIAYQSAFGIVENTTYFSGLNLPHRVIRDYPIGHLPHNRYLIASATA